MKNLQMQNNESQNIQSATSAAISKESSMSLLKAVNEVIADVQISKDHLSATILATPTLLKEQSDKNIIAYTIEVTVSNCSSQVTQNQLKEGDK